MSPAVRDPVDAPALRLYLPVLATAAVTAGLLWAGSHGTPLHPDPAREIATERAQLIGPSIVGFVVAVIVLERVWPAVRRPLLARGHVHDALYLVMYAAAVVPLVAMVGVAFSALLREHATWLELPRLGFMPRWSIVVVALLAMDFCNWLAHLANHLLEPLWRLHAVHHTQEELSILTSFRAHPLVHTSFLVSTIPVVALLANGGLPAVVITAYVCLGAMPHANVPWSYGPLGRLLVSPAYHRAHHAATGRIDVNLGTVFTIWDVATRRAVFPIASDGPPIATGLAGRPIAVEQSGLRTRHLATMAIQLLEPFSAAPVPRRPQGPDGAALDTTRAPEIVGAGAV
jgi:sterol desaturase/sphingolipid hydroxylase (fatty acid hydroxylase superfamily)